MSASFHCRSLAGSQRLLLCALAVFVLCVVTATGQQKEDTKSARIEGIVVSTTGEAFPRAKVRLTPVNSQRNMIGKAAYETETRDDGTFVIDRIAAPESNLSLTARPRGTSAPSFGTREPSVPFPLFSLDEGQVRKDIVVTIIPQGVVSGTVTDEAGEPIQGAGVSALTYDYRNRQKLFRTENWAQTNDRGEYRIAKLPPGRYFLSATMPRPPSNNETWLNTFYPNTRDPLAAAPVQVTSGQELPGMDIQLLRGHGYTVNGKVVGLPAGSTVDLLCFPEAWLKGGLSAMAAKMQPARVRPDGSFEFKGIHSGLYVLHAAVSGFPPQHAGMLPVTVDDHDIRDLVFPLTDGVTVTGSIKFEEDKAPNLRRLRLALQWAKGMPPTAPPPGRVEADGSFTFKHLAAGEYYLDKLNLPGVYIKSIRLNGSDVTGSTLNLAGNGTMEIVLGQNAPKVTGVVRNEKGKPQGGMRVFLSPEEPNESLSDRGTQVISTDIDGAFTMDTVAPGTYYAVAIEPVDTLPMLVREFPELLRGKASKVEVSEGLPASVDLELIPTTEVMRAAEKAP